MDILNKKPKSLATFLCLAIFFNFCSTKNPSGTSRSFIDSTSFPKANFYSVALLSLDSGVKTNILTDSGTFTDTSILEYVDRPGFTFINKNGEPKTSRVHVFLLDSVQIKRIQSFFKEQPCKESLIMDKSCVPYFRNVFIFYDENKIPIAQVHICFNCEMTYLYPRKDYMCDLDNKVDFNALRNFTDSIKHHF
jgi:hypothetical protein